MPGTWVEPPSVGVYWTPAWWGFNDGFYGFHEGYWGPEVGFYGGINYGFGYNGFGFFGGRWNGGAFAYNSNYNNFGGRLFDNAYSENASHGAMNRVSFNGGNGGVRAQPTAQQAAAEHAQHVGATSAQAEHFHAAASNPALRAATNHGRPGDAATAKPNDFSHGVAARSAGPGAALRRRSRSASRRGARRTEHAGSARWPGRRGRGGAS